MAEYIERDALMKYPIRIDHCDMEHGKLDFVLGIESVLEYAEYLPAADVVEVLHDYHEGDVCIYGYGAENKSRAIVEIVKVLNDERGVAEVKFLKVFVDDTGNGLFNYLLKRGKTMNASFQYLKNITPRMEVKSNG